MIPVADIADRLNAIAPSLAPELLPNGYKSGVYWMASGIDDSGRSGSLAVNLSGTRIGHWSDYGNARVGEEHGDMLDLLRLMLGLADAGAAVAEAKVRLGIQDEFTPDVRRADPAELERRAAAAKDRTKLRQDQDERDRELKARNARRMWLAAAPIAGTPAEFYLQGRGLDGAQGWPGSLHYHAEIWCSEIAVKVPAMLATIINADGAQIGVHRTYLQNQRRGWEKLDVLKPKKVMGNAWGGFIPINKGSSRKPMAAMPEGEAVFVTEGIEDAIVVRMMKPEARIIAAVSLGNVGAIVLPPAARLMVVVCDRDSNQAALDQLERSIARQQARGIAVKTVFPDAPHKDMNDWLQAWRRDERTGRAA